MSGETVTLKLDDVKTIAKAALMAAGADNANAEAITHTVWMAERDGCASHGLFRIPGYCGSLRSGKVNGTARPRLERSAPSVLWVDGDGGYSPIAHKSMLDDFAELVHAQGVALAAVTNTFHFAALWPEVEMLSKRGLAAIACTSYKPTVAPHGGSRPLFGTNPLAFSWPRPEGDPVTFDQASATMARGDIQIHARDGKPVPLGVGIDKAGSETRDPNAILDGGAQLAFGGYKGSSIAMMVELLAGPLLGENLSLEAAETDIEDGGPARGGEFILAFDPAKTRQPSKSGGNAERLFQAMLAQEGVRLPGEGRLRRRAEVARNGVVIPRSLMAQIEV
ncbi:MAG: Ldh family oxidoreductase [Nitratireductor sp.]|nr:Ldh family oxidoreductase [Nitratireductor sp.]